jgi:hypothetical protein
MRRGEAEESWDELEPRPFARREQTRPAYVSGGGEAQVTPA